MRKRLTILGLVFLSSLLFFFFLFNFHKRSKAAPMAGPKLPGITVEFGGRQINRLYGYTTAMDGSYMRGTITPLTDSDRLRLAIESYGRTVKSLGYELRSGDGQRQLADGPADLESGANGLSATVDLSGRLEEETEYLLVLTLELSGSNEKICYYTRVLKSKTDHVREILDFAGDFQEKSLTDRYTDLAVYLNDPGKAVSSADLSDVNLDSGISQIGYGSLKAGRLGETEFSFTDVNANYSMLESHFILKKEDEGVSRYFDVREYFRIRYKSKRMDLMDYQRRMEPIQTPGNISVTDAKLNLGQGNASLNYLANETGTLICFVSGGDLFEYDQEKESLKRVFSFRDDSNLTDPRGNHAEHEIKLLNVDEAGTMDFVVYGYMNAGAHEGQVGINLYHYDSVTGQTQERAFVRSSKSYQILRASFSDLLYMNGRQEFYLMMGGTVMKIHLKQGKTEELLRDVKMGQYQVSQSGRYLAYTDAREPSDRIHIMDLETGDRQDLDAPQGQKIRPLAFMDEDLAYGIIRPEDRAEDPAGNVTSPMYRVVIRNIREDKELLSYQKDGFFVVDGVRRGTNLLMRRVRRENDHYTAADSDTITNSLSKKADAAEVRAEEDPSLGTVTTVQLVDPKQDKKNRKQTGEIKYREAGLLPASKKAIVQADPSDGETYYFVYQGSRVDLTTDRVVDAIERADADMGLVVDSKLHYIWRRDKRAYVGALSGFGAIHEADRGADSSVRALSAILMREKRPTEVSALAARGKSPVQILNENLEGFLAVNLTGAQLSQVLYYVSNGSPVYALLPGGDTVLIVGYSADTIRYIRPGTGNVISVGMDSIRKQLEAAGNVFISYVEAK